MESLCGFGKKDERGTVSKDDWMHIVNKHPSLPQSLHEDVACDVSSVLAADDESDKGCSGFDPMWFQQNNNGKEWIFFFFLFQTG